MSNVNITRSGPEVFKDNETGYHDSYTRNRDYRPQQFKPTDFRVYAVWFIACIGSFIVLWIVYGLWKLIYCWNDNHYSMCSRLDTFEPFVFLIVLSVPIVLTVLNVVAKVWTRTRFENALANRTNLALNRYGDSEPADLFDRLSTPQLLALLDMRYTSAAMVELRNAPHKRLRGVNTLSIHENEATALNDDQNDLIEDAPLAPLAPVEWLAIADQQPHIMLAGSTGKGKTTTAKALLLTRLQAKEQLFVIDPHSSNWYGIAGRAGGENWADCADAIQEIFLEYKYRINERYQHLLLTGNEMAEDHFPRLTILVDEAFLIKENLDTGSSRKQVNYWSLLAEIMSSGARKIGISLMLLTQTANVEDLGISGPLRRNFFRIALDAPSMRLMITREESDHTRRAQLLTSITELEYAATAEINGQIYALDRLDLLSMAQIPVDAKSCLWTPTDGRPSVSYGQGSSVLSALRTRTDGIIAQLAALRRQGISREDARTMHGLEFTNADWTQAGQMLANENSGAI
jgi:hypothetical protein